MTKREKIRQENDRIAAERLADRNRRWKAAIDDCMEGGYSDGCWNESALAAVFDAIASEASGSEIPELLRR